MQQKKLFMNKYQIYILLRPFTNSYENINRQWFWNNFFSYSRPTKWLVARSANSIGYFLFYHIQESTMLFVIVQSRVYRHNMCCIVRPLHIGNLQTSPTLKKFLIHNTIFFKILHPFKLKTKYALKLKNIHILCILRWFNSKSVESMFEQ